MEREIKKLESKFFNIFTENSEREDNANFLFKNKKFITELADTAFINVGFVNKKLSSLEQGSLIAGEVEYLNRFKNFKKFLGNINAKPKKGDDSIISHIKRRIEEYDEILDNSSITKYNKTLFTLKKNKAIKALQILDDLIGILNFSYAKMKKIRKKNSGVLKKIKKIVLNKENKKEFEKEKDIIFSNIRNCIVDLEPNIQYINFSIFLTNMSKLKIIESSMGH
jgi:hypothetical protein